MILETMKEGLHKIKVTIPTFNSKKNTRES
jgi:hypothetical protein